MTHAHNQNTPAEALVLEVEGMTCSACSGHVEQALNGLAGTRASVDLARGTATIEGLNRSDLALAIAAIEDAGYQARERVASDSDSQ